MDLGTRVFTYFKGRQVGADAVGNRYFTERRPSPRRARVRRWVIYPVLADPSSVPAEWHAWLHYTTDAPLTDRPRHDWQKPHLANATGTAAAYRPPGHDYAGGKRAKADGDYESWVPADPPIPATPATATPATAAETRPETYFTLARHSGYAVGANPAFEDAVEVRELTTRQLYMVRAAGGVVFTTREAARQGEDAANYPNGLKSGRAQASGYFSSLRVAGAEIFVPTAGPQPRR
ncbi:MAG: NADH:ubiquinone oxidoreductase subunit NDUFA12 [Rhodopila sp.]